MAQMIPDEVPPGKSIGEKLLFSRLQSLPDDCIVYYEPTIKGRRPDFVVIIPDSGLLVLEAKGWRAPQLLGGDSHQLSIRSAAGGEAREPNPIRQATEYMYGLMDACRRQSAGQQLLNATGPHRGKFIFPFGSCAVLTQITDSELREHRSGDLRLILPVTTVVSADEFEQWTAFTELQLKERLRSFFNPTWQFPPLLPAQIEPLRAIIHPEVRVPPGPSDMARHTDTDRMARLADDSADLKNLDLNQERLARSLGDGHRLLFGVAGSGKTVILIARARFLSEALPSGRILVLCFNVALRTYLKEILASSSNVDVYTFHGWGGHHGIPYKPDESTDAYGERLGAELGAGHGDAGRYDAVLIDEAQDFDPTWFMCATAALKEPRTGDLLIVGDGNQTNYQRGHVSWAKLGISAKGRSRILRRNYRNTRPIMAAAAPFADDAANDDGIAATRGNLTDACRDSAILPVLIQRHTRQEEIAAIEATVQRLLDGSFAPQLPELSPSEIGIIYRRTNEHLKQLLERLQQMAPVLWLSRPWEQGKADARQKVLAPGIKVQTAFAAKGLQYRAVILIFADQLGGRTEDVEKDRHLLYVALTRPEDALIVTCVTSQDIPRSHLMETMLASGAFRGA